MPPLCRRAESSPLFAGGDGVRQMSLDPSADAASECEASGLFCCEARGLGGGLAPATGIRATRWPQRGTR